MKVHAAVGADILKSINFPYPVEPIVRYHHEAWNGSGYPEGLKGTDIPLGARILSVVDCYDALTSDRPYRPRMTRAQAEQELKDRRGRIYDPWVVDTFLGIIDSLEASEAAERKAESRTNVGAPITQSQLDVISATNAEEREFNELRRELPRTKGLAEATDVLFRHLRRVLPVASLALYQVKPDTNELVVVASSGAGTSAFEGLQVPLGERISGWSYAHQQVVFNSDAALEIGPVAKTFAVPLRYAAAVPLTGAKAASLIMIYGSDPFDKDHERLLENAATLFASSTAVGPDAPAQRPELAASSQAQNKARVH
jgi:hypothetical protein